MNSNEAREGVWAVGKGGGWVCSEAKSTCRGENHLDSHPNSKCIPKLSQYSIKEALVCDMLTSLS